MYTLLRTKNNGVSPPRREDHTLLVRKRDQVTPELKIRHQENISYV